jgi:hypothetical protein
MLIDIGISFATWLGGKIADKGFDAIIEKLTSKDEIDAKFKQCVELAANKLENKYPDILGNSIAYFFTQEEVFEELIKLLFVNQKVNEEVIAQFFDISTLPKGFILEFVTELKGKLGNEPIFQELLANKELYITVTGISKNVEDISRNSTLTTNEIAEIRKLLENQFKRDFNLTNYLSAYKKNLITIIKTINFIGLGVDPSIKEGKKHKELDSIFVKPTFQINSKYHLELEEQSKKKLYGFDSENKISFNQLFDRDYNYIILGNAGAGKSLLVKAIMLYLSESKKEFKNTDILTYVPFRIELKNYIAFKKQSNKGCSILKYLVYSLETDYSSTIVEENLQNILIKENTILFFDGLDEIFNVQDKITVKNDIETFHNNFPKIKSITTSRFTGYNEARFDEKKYCELSILPFNEDQIKEYVQKWYSLEEEDTTIREDEISGFISNMDNIDKELISNPLLLSLIVILYRNNLKIPESKLEIYQSCTNTLVDKWDALKQLDITIDKPLLQKKESILADLAFWQYEALSSSMPEINNHKAKYAIAESLVKKKLADDDNKDILAESFLDYAQKRSIYFDNNFTHKTFLEYYTAYWIYSNVEKKHDIEKRNKIIEQYIKNPFWYVVLELLFNLIDKDQPDTDILDEIIEENSNSTSSLAFLLHVLPSLKNVSEDTQILVYTKTIEHILSLKVKEPKKNDGNRGRVKYNLFEKIQMNAVNSKQKDIITKSIINFQDKKLDFYILMEELEIFRYRIGHYAKFEFNAIKDTIEYKGTVLTNSYLFFLSELRSNNDTKYFESLLQYIELFGTDTVFKDNECWFSPGMYFCIFDFYISNQLKKQNIKSFHGNLEILDKKSIPKIMLLKHLAKKSYPFLLEDGEAIQYLFDTLEQIDEIAKTINLVLLGQAFQNNLFSNNNIDNFNTTPTIKELINKISKVEKAKVLEIIINELKITDEQILSLLK